MARLEWPETRRRDQTRPLSYARILVRCILMIPGDVLYDLVVLRATVFFFSSMLLACNEQNDPRTGILFLLRRKRSLSVSRGFLRNRHIEPARCTIEEAISYETGSIGNDLDESFPRF